MKKIMTALMIATFSAGVSAAAFDKEVYEHNHDLYEGGSHSTKLAITSQPGIGDAYGGSVYEHTAFEGLVKGMKPVDDDYNGRDFLNTDNLSTTW